jgi:uncharacterized protein YraI
MTRLAAYLVTASVIATGATATPATITTAVNCRAGPGTSYQSLGKLCRGSSVGSPNAMPAALGAR